MIPEKEQEKIARSRGAQDIACAVSDLLWGGELGWVGREKETIEEMRRRWKLVTAAATKDRETKAGNCETKAEDHATKVEVIMCAAAEELNTIRATLMANFGPDSKQVDGVLVTPQKSIHNMVFDVLDQYHRLCESRARDCEAKPPRLECTTCGGTDLNYVELVPRILHVESIDRDHVILEVEESIDCKDVKGQVLRCTHCGKEWPLPQGVTVDYA